MVKYIVTNMQFDEEDEKLFEASDDSAAIEWFRQHYEMYTDDGGWKLTRIDTPDNILATTEYKDNPIDKPFVNYLNYG